MCRSCKYANDTKSKLNESVIPAQAGIQTPPAINSRKSNHTFTDFSFQSVLDF
jgi:hypothetical protein